MIGIIVKPAGKYTNYKVGDLVYFKEDPKDFGIITKIECGHSFAVFWVIDHRVLNHVSTSFCVKPLISLTS